MVHISLCSGMTMQRTTLHQRVAKHGNAKQRFSEAISKPARNLLLRVARHKVIRYPMPPILNGGRYPLKHRGDNLRKTRDVMSRDAAPNELKRSRRRNPEPAWSNQIKQGGCTPGKSRESTRQLRAIPY